MNTNYSKISITNIFNWLFFLPLICNKQCGGGWMICHFLNILLHFVFCQLYFLVLFPFLIKYYGILFIIIVIRLGSDKLSSVSTSVFTKGSVTGCDSTLGGGWVIFHFRVLKSILFFGNWISLYFSISYIVITCYVYYYCI